MAEDTRDYLSKQIDLHRARTGADPTTEELSSQFALLDEHRRAAVLDTIAAESKGEMIGDDSASLRAAGKRARVVQQLHRVHRTLRAVNR
jgi:hypothetical protein